jgi:hypothetical protein
VSQGIHDQSPFIRRRERARETSQLKTASWLNYSTIISSLALAISLSSFYFTWVRVDHSLKLGVVSSGGDDTELPLTYYANLILLNPGNRTETALTLELLFGSTLHSYEFDPKSVKGPFVLKPGDAIPIRIEWKIGQNNFDDAAEWRGPQFSQIASAKMYVRVHVVSPNGAETEKIFPVGNLVYNQASAAVEYQQIQPDKLGLHELLH